VPENPYENLIFLFLRKSLRTLTRRDTVVPENPYENLIFLFLRNSLRTLTRRDADKKPRSSQLAITESAELKLNSGN
jgi:hypothetical protein